jgi:hypothetical protein
MAKCRKCGDYVSYRGICPACLKKFTDARDTCLLDALQKGNANYRF